MKRINNVDRLFMAFVITLGIFCMPSCEKEPDKPAGGNKIEVSATSIEAVTYSFGDLEATISGYDSNNVNITNHGFYWSTIPDPDLNSSLVELGRRNKFGSFNTRLSDLDENKKYYVRAFANIPGGTILGPSTEFTTLERGPAVVKIDSLSSIMGNSASCFSSVLSDGGYDVTARGVCWNTTGNPTLQNCINFTSDGIGIGSFTSNITGLSPSTTYFVRAYATNSEGTAYDVDDVSFTTLTPWSCGATLGITHTAGAIAPVNKTVNYGTVQTNLTGSNKCWITQNLGADHQATSATDATEASAGWYWQFNRKQGYKHDGTTRTPSTTWISSINENSDWLPANDPCALLLGSGWRLPTNTEWTNAVVTGGWDNYNETFASVLKLHAAGYLSNIDGSLFNRGSYGYYWSSSQLDSYYGRLLYFGSSDSFMRDYDEAYGFSARCLRD
ncbi:MAG: hypothetical protein AB2L17_01335 [Lentimicrobium sp.]